MAAGTPGTVQEEATRQAGAAATGRIIPFLRKAPPAAALPPLEPLIFAANIAREDDHGRTVEYCLIASPDRPVLQCKGEWIRGRAPAAPWRPAASAHVALLLIKLATANRRVIATELQPEDLTVLPLEALGEKAQILRASRLYAHLSGGASPAEIIADIKAFKIHIGAGRATALETACAAYELLLVQLDRDGLTAG